MGNTIVWSYLGETEYAAALGLQYCLYRSCRRNLIHSLLLLQHPPTITLGYRSRREQLLFSPAEMREKEIQFFLVSRGGGATYHGPGQLVGYPIFSLQAWGGGVRGFVERLEEVLLFVLASYGVRGRRHPQFPGVWVGEKKIGAVGIRVKHGVSFHGFSLNVDLDLRPFHYIRPCGLSPTAVTTLRLEAGSNVEFSGVAGRTVEGFRQVFGAALDEVSYEQICAHGDWPGSQENHYQSSRPPQCP